MATVTQVAIRCAGCHRRLADVVNEVEAGQVLVELKCPRCRQPHLEVIRPQPTGIPIPPKGAGKEGVSIGLGLIASVASSLWAFALSLSLVLTTSTSAFPRLVSNVFAEPLTDVNGGGRVCDLMGSTLEEATHEPSPAREEAEPGVTVQARPGAQSGGEAAAIGETESEAQRAASCGGHEPTSVDRPSSRPG